MVWILFPYFGTLAPFGELIKISVLTDDLPSLEAFNPETLYLNFEIILDSKASLEEIEAVLVLPAKARIIIVPLQQHPGLYRFNPLPCQKVPCWAKF